MPFALPALGLAAKLSGVGGFLKKVPWQLWAVIVLLVTAGVGGCVVKNKIEAFGTERYETGKKDGRASRDAEITTLQNQKAEADRKLAAELRKRVNAENAAVDNRANSLRLRGPGRATCPNPPAASTSAGGRNSPPAEADASGLGVPTDNWAAVPWGWLVGRAVEHDKCLIEANAWRKQKAAEIDAYNKGR